MKRSILGVGIAALLLLAVQPAAQAASAQSVSGKQFFCIGVMAGFVQEYVLGVRPMLDTFTFSTDFFSVGFLSIEGLNDAAGAYTIDDDGLFEKVESTCVAFSDDGVYLRYKIKAVNIINICIVGTVALEGTKDFDEAGEAAGFFFGVRNIFD